MHRMLKVAAGTALFVGTLALAPFMVSGDAVAEGTAGQDLFLAQKCNMCHAVSTVGIEAKMKSPAMMGPDLKGVGQRLDAETVAKYMRKETQIEGKDHKKEWKGTPEELEALIAWLNEQK